MRKTFVLIHGAWHGGWCWRRVADLLEAKGHKVFAPTLTGVGDRSHLLSKDITLDTHIADIVNLFQWEDISDVVPRRAFLRRLAELGRARADRRPGVVDRVARCLQAGERPAGIDYRLRRSAARRWQEAAAKGERRPQAAAKADGVRRQREGSGLGQFQADRRSRTALRCSRSSSPARASGSRSKTYIRAPNYPQPRSTRPSGVQGRPDLDDASSRPRSATTS